MSTATSQDLIIQILGEAGVVPDGQTPQIEDISGVETALPFVLEQLAAREILYVPDLDNIPSAWIMPLAKIVAYELHNKFGITGQELLDLKASAVESEGRIKSMTRGRPTGEALRIDYF